MKQFKPILMCLKCGYRNKYNGIDTKWPLKDRNHQKTCDFTMTIRYILPNGKIVGGSRSLF